MKRKFYSYEYLPPTLKEKYKINNLKTRMNHTKIKMERINKDKT